MASGPYPFSGKCIEYPGTCSKKKIDIRKFHPKDAGKTIEVIEIDKEMINDSNRDINDLRIYTFPTSMFVDTPDFSFLRVFHKGKQISQVDNMDSDGNAAVDMDSIEITDIDPPIKDGEKFRVQMFFEDSFDGGEGYVILGTFDGAYVGCNDKALAAIPIPEGPSVFDVVKEAITTGASIGSTFIGKNVQTDDSEGGNAALLASALTGSKNILKENMKPLIPILAKNNPALMMVLNEAYARSGKRKYKSFKASIVE